MKRVMREGSGGSRIRIGSRDNGRPHNAYCQPTPAVSPDKAKRRAAGDCIGAGLYPLARCQPAMHHFSSTAHVACMGQLTSFGQQ